MSSTLILEERTAKDLLGVLNLPANNALLQQILVYFTPYCDCDIRAWLIEQIDLGLQEVPDPDALLVIEKLLELMAGTIPIVVPNVVESKLPTGYLIATQCDGPSLVGAFATGTGNTSVEVLVANSPECGTSDTLIEDSLNDFNSSLIREHMPEIGLGYNSQYSEFPNGSGPGENNGTIYDTLWRFDQARGGRLMLLPYDDPGVAQRLRIDDYHYDEVHVHDTVLANDTPIRANGIETGITINAGLVTEHHQWPSSSWITLALEIPPDIVEQQRDGYNDNAIYVTLVVRMVQENGDNVHSLHVITRGKGSMGAQWYDVVNPYTGTDEFTWQWNQILTSAQQAGYSQDKVRGDDNDYVPWFLCKMRNPSNPDQGRLIDFRVITAGGQMTVYVNEIPVLSKVYSLVDEPIPTEGWRAGFGFEFLTNNQTVEFPNYRAWMSNYFLQRKNTTDPFFDLAVLRYDVSVEYHRNPNPALLARENFFVQGTTIPAIDTGATGEPGQPAGKWIFMLINGFPTVDGVPDRSNITFQWYDLSSRYLDGFREGQLLNTRQTCAPKGNLTYDENTGMVTIEWTAAMPPWDAPRVTFLAISHRGEEFASLAIFAYGPGQNNQVQTQSVTAMTYGVYGTYRYPYLRQYLNYP